MEQTDILSSAAPPQLSSGGGGSATALWWPRGRRLLSTQEGKMAFSAFVGIVALLATLQTQGRKKSEWVFVEIIIIGWSSVFESAQKQILKFPKTKVLALIHMISTSEWVHFELNYTYVLHVTDRKRSKCVMHHTTFPNIWCWLPKSIEENQDLLSSPLIYYNCFLAKSSTRRAMSPLCRNSKFVAWPSSHVALLLCPQATK